jgi:hypothetical protein
MATIKKNTLLLSSGRRIKLSGDSLSIGPTLEVGNGYTFGIFAFNRDSEYAADLSPVTNPLNFNQEELLEIADYYISLWVVFKDKIRTHGTESPKIFLRS